MQGLRVLVVEDDFILNLNLREHLQSIGFNVETAYCGAAAFEVIDRGRPLSALISDVELGPGADGLSVARHARAAYPGVAVVLMSGTCDAARAHREIPGADFIAKPFHMRDVDAALDRQIRPLAPLA